MMGISEILYVRPIRWGGFNFPKQKPEACSLWEFHPFPVWTKHLANFTKILWGYLTKFRENEDSIRAPRL